MNIIKKYNKFTKFLRNVVFGYSTPRCIGIDINDDVVHMVELCENSLVISNYKTSKIMKNNTEKTLTSLESMADILNYEWNNFNGNYNYAAIKITNNNVVIKRIIIPNEINELEVSNYIHEELFQELGIRDIDFDYRISKSDDKNSSAYTAIVKKYKIEEYYALMELADIKIAAIEVDDLALESLFIILLKINNVFDDVWFVNIEAGYLKIYFVSNYSIVHSESIMINYQNIMRKPLNDLDEKDILKQITFDINKLIRGMYSNLVLNNNPISNEKHLYIISVDFIFDNLPNNIIDSGLVTVCKFINELFPPQPLLSSRIEFMHLLTAIALATWGHEFA